MSIIKAIHDVIITRNDIISTLITISVTSFRKILEIMTATDIDYRSDYHILVYCVYSNYPGTRLLL